jgi:hypothetical protein
VEEIVYEPQRILNPNDDSVYVELKRMTKLKYRERKTQVTLLWEGGFGSTI